MSDMEQIWREKSDEDLLEAAAHLAEFTTEGQRVIREELKRRGLEDPVEQARDADSETAASELEEREAEGGTLVGPDCTRCHIELRYRGTRMLLGGDAGHLFSESDAFQVCVCPQCGHVELFVGEISAEPPED